LLGFPASSTGMNDTDKFFSRSFATNFGKHSFVAVDTVSANCIAKLHGKKRMHKPFAYHFSKFTGMWQASPHIEVQKKFA
jgi:hypothetical protein